MIDEVVHRLALGLDSLIAFDLYLMEEAKQVLAHMLNAGKGRPVGKRRVRAQVDCQPKSAIAFMQLQEEEAGIVEVPK